MLAPDESRTVPVTEAESWAWRSVAENRAITKTILLTRRRFIRDSLNIEMRTAAWAFERKSLAPDLERIPNCIDSETAMAVAIPTRSGKIPLLKRVNSA